MDEREEVPTKNVDQGTPTEAANIQVHVDVEEAVQEPILNTELTITPENEDEAKTEDGPMPSFGKIITLSRPEWPALFFAFILMVGGELLGLVPPLFLATAYDVVVNPLLGVDRKESQVAETMIYVLLLTAGAQLIGFMRGVIMGFAGHRVVARLRNSLFKSILRQEMGFFDARKTGELVSRLGSDTTVIQTVTTSSIAEAILGFLKVGISMGLMFYISAELTGIILGVAFFLCLLALPFGKWIAKISKRYQDALAKAQGVSTEALGSMQTVRSFAAEAKEAERYRKHIGKPNETKCWWPRKANDKNSTYRMGIKSALGMTIFVNLMFCLSMLAMYTTQWMGFEMVIAGSVTFGNLMAFQAYIYQIAFGLAASIGHMTQIMKVQGSSQRVLELLERVPGLLPKPDGCIAFPKNFRGDVEFENVWFSYPTCSDVDVLQDFSLKVPANSTAALVGSSGSGKSTVVALLQRFYDVTKGYVRIDGFDIRDLDSDELHSHIGFVQQEPVLFAMTIRENVCYGAREQATDEEVEQACRQANAYDFINKFPDKYDTVVGERGVRLSGGQKQRICIARALLINPRILILDEATSALDAESEYLVQQAIEKVMVGRTTVIVAHRLSTVRHADQIVVLHEHSIVDVGTHDLLLERCDKYKELIKRQTDVGTNEKKIETSRDNGSHCG